MTALRIIEIDSKRFTALVNQSRSPAATYVSREIEWFATEDEAILGVVIMDTVDDDYLGIALGRDEVGAYRAFDISQCFETQQEAHNWLHGAMRWHAGTGEKTFPQGDAGKRVDFFEAVVPQEQQHPLFVQLCREHAFLPAREIINAIVPHFRDIDGNFVQQFQSSGFDSRLWELYIQAYLVEEELFLEREHSAPDFLVTKYGESVAIEAVIVGRKSSNPAKLFRPKEDLFKYIDVAKQHENEMPIRFGSPLFSKLQKKYWELDHVAGKPLVFAIADFHDDQSMLWSGTALHNYLYGVRHNFYHDSNGQLIISPLKIETHKVGDKEIPSGFFFQPQAENVSAILFSSSGTISKFNRIGRQAGFKHPDVRMIRMGTHHDHDPNASLPRMFRYEVDESCEETWAEGLSMFHNPNAVHPVPEHLFPTIAHHHFEDGQIVSRLPAFYPYASVTLNLTVKQDDS